MPTAGPTTAGPTGAAPDAAAAPVEAGRLAPEPPPAAASLLGEGLAGACAYAELLCGPGTVRGLLGPREAERIWDRHLLNSAAVAELVPVGSAVVDLGSGAGLPGVVLALTRSDLKVVLMDSLARRTTFLTEVVEELGLGDRVSVVRARAEEVRRDEDVVVARAVGELRKLSGWARGLLRRDGTLLAMVGESGVEELAALGGALPRWAKAEVITLEPAGITPVRVVRARRR